MLRSGIIIAYAIVFSRSVALADPSIHAKSMDYDLSDQSASQTSTKSLLESQSNTSESYSSSISDTSTSTAETVRTSSALTATTACDVSRPKFAINDLLINSNEQLVKTMGQIQNLTKQVDECNSQQIGNLIASELQKILPELGTCTSSIQACGVDPQPLSANEGITLSDVSWSAFQVVLTLKNIFESVSGLYPRFSLIQKSCSGILLNTSTGLAGLIGACSEQLNLFDTHFFPLLTPQLQQIQAVDDNFSAFFGSFVPSA